VAGGGSAALCVAAYDPSQASVGCAAIPDSGRSDPPVIGCRAPIKVVAVPASRTARAEEQRAGESKGKIGSSEQSEPVMVSLPEFRPHDEPATAFHIGQSTQFAREWIEEFALAEEIVKRIRTIP
jgi:hypothetical protein